MKALYQKSGVNYNLMDPFKNECLKLGGQTPNIYEFKDYFLTDILEGLGSLSQLADDIYHQTSKDYYYQAGWGNAASILNDLSSLGATPLAIKLFVGAGHQNWFKDTHHWKKLIQGFSDAAKLAKAIWNGGETQTLTNVINPKSVVLAGSAIGIIKPKQNLLTEAKLQEGDRIILIKSSGLHTNGATLVRKLAKSNPLLGESAIKPKTIIYSPLIESLLNSNITLHYASHITGHGWRKIMRSKKDFTYTILDIPNPPKIFKLIQKISHMSNQQIYSDYNMGAGLALFAPPREVKKIIKLSNNLGLKALNAGYISEGDRKVIIKPLNLTLEGTSLQIR